MSEKEKKVRKWRARGTLALVIMIALAGSFRYLSGYVTVSSNVNGRELPIYSVKTDAPQVALTFDAAWGDEGTREILDILKKHDVRVTFFMTGDWVDKYPEEVQAIQAAGHDLGNHSQSHKNMTQLSEEEQGAEITEVHEKVKALTGVEMNLFRAPYGAYNDSVILSAKELGYHTVQWSVDTVVNKRSAVFTALTRYIRCQYFHLLGRLFS